ncbi:MAG: glycosyltransferase [Clostridiaceae bacterium]
MNQNKICFITCVNDDDVYNECLKYIKNLNIPENFELETLGIKEAKSITSGYNEAMKSSDAKYKVYLHQDVFIINKNFIHDVINTFSLNSEIGILGIAGANTIPTNATWWDSTHRYGKVYENHTGKMKLLNLGDVEGNYQEVKAVDGFLIATQYDIPWREDIFTGWHFYDISQCIEVTLKGYKAVIPKQDEPWCIHDCGFVETTGNYDVYRDVFLDEYCKKIFPLVSILIPTYNRPEFLKIALESAVNQTYRNIEIIICDDSTNNITNEMINSEYRNSEKIIYHKNKGKSDALKNFDKCLELCKGLYINYLMDDDLFDKTKIEKMMYYFIEYDDVNLVTSSRKVIDENGNISKDISATKKLFDKDTIIDGKKLSQYLLNNLTNYIGEPTTALVKRRKISSVFGMYNKKRYYYNVDVAAWLEILSSGKCVYMSETLSYFRIHKGQNQKKTNSDLIGQIEWFNLIQDSYKDGLINDINLYKSILNKWLVVTTERIRLFNLNEEKFLKELYKYIDYVLKELLF